MPRGSVLTVGYDHPGTLTAQGLVTVDPSKYTGMWVSDTSEEPFAKITLLNGTFEGQRFDIGSDGGVGVVDSLVMRHSGNASGPTEFLSFLSSPDLFEPYLYGFLMTLVWSGGQWNLERYRRKGENATQTASFLGNSVDSVTTSLEGSSNVNTIIHGFTAGANTTKGTVVLHGNSSNSTDSVVIGVNTAASNSNRAVAILGGVTNAPTKGVVVGDGCYVHDDYNVAMGLDSFVPVGNRFSHASGIGGVARFAGAMAKGLANGAHSAARAQKVEAVMAANLTASTATQLETVSIAGPTKRKVQFGNNAFARVEIETVVFTTGFAKSATVTHKVFVKTNGTGVITVVTAAAISEAMINTGFATAPTVTIGSSGVDLTIAVNAPETAKAVSYVRAIEVI
jgi:hypothetical protein